MVEIKQNRKSRRHTAAIIRRGARRPGMGMGKHANNGNKFRFMHVSWIKRIIREMADNDFVISRVTSGRLDKYLEKK